MNHRANLDFTVTHAREVRDAKRPHANAEFCVTFEGLPGLRLDFSDNLVCKQVTIHGNRVVLDGRANYVPMDRDIVKARLARAERSRAVKAARERVLRAQEALRDAEAALRAASD